MTSYSGNAYGRNTPEGVYYTGLLSIWQIATWLYNDMLEYGPDVDFGVTKVPSPRGVDGKPGQLVANMYFVPTGCQNPDGGFEFAWFMGSSPWVAANKAGPDSVTPSRVSNALLPELEAVEPWLAMARDEILPYAWPEPSMPSWGFYRNGINAALEEVLWNDADPEMALDLAVEEAQLEVDQKLEQ
jgi:maltose-binding protein MalE